MREDLRIIQEQSTDLKSEDLGRLIAEQGAAVVVEAVRDESVDLLTQAYRDANVLGFEALKVGKVVQINIVPAVKQ